MRTDLDIAGRRATPAPAARRRCWRAAASASTCLAIVTVPATLLHPAGDPGTLLPPPVVAALAAELSGTEAKRVVQELSAQHRMRGSRGFKVAAERIRDRARAYGLSAVEIIELPADGEIDYGTQRSRPGWDADFAELWELRESKPTAEGAGAGSSEWSRAVRIASFATRPVTLAQDSASGRVTTELVDVGPGDQPRDYEGLDVRGKLVLTSSQPGIVAPLAVDERGAAGIVSYAQNQKSAWWKEDETLVRWGHLDTFPRPSTFAFMVSLKQARAWRERLQRGETVRLEAIVEAGQHPGAYLIPTAVLPGREDPRKVGEIVFSCHLDHQLPGANDNASGCAAILEVARTLSALVRDGRLEAPRRSIRFIWPPEIEGTIALLNARPQIAERTRAVVHMDMVGGSAASTKAVFHVTRSPRSLPTFVNDVAEHFGRFVDDQATRFAAGEDPPHPMIDPEGGKDALLARFVDFTMGSDHQIWTEGSFRTPAIYLNDWPDRYIHTHADSIANIDATKLYRAAYIGAASGYYLAQLDAEDVPDLWRVIRRHALERAARALDRQAAVDRLGGEPAGGLLRFQLDYELAVIGSIADFAPFPATLNEESREFLGGLSAVVTGNGGLAAGVAPESDPDATAAASRVYRRSPEPKGPMNGFGFSYFDRQLEQLELARPALLDHEGLWGGGAEYGYEALNLVDGKRSVRQVRDDLTAIYGPVPLKMVADYLETLARIGVLN